MFKGSCVNLPGVRRWTEGDGVIRRSTCEGAGLIVVCVTISMWARLLENLRVGRGLACVRCSVRAAATVLRLPESLARALARDAFTPINASHLELRRTNAVEVDHASGVGTIGATTALGNHQHREVVPVHEADVEEIEAAVAVQGELGERGWRGSAASGTFQLSGAAITCDAGEFSGGVVGAEGSAPEAASP